MVGHTIGEGHIVYVVDMGTVYVSGVWWGMQCMRTLLEHRWEHRWRVVEHTIVAKEVDVMSIV